MAPKCCSWVGLLAKEDAAWGKPCGHWCLHPCYGLGKSSRPKKLDDNTWQRRFYLAPQGLEAPATLCFATKPNKSTLQHEKWLDNPIYRDLGLFDPKVVGRVIGRGSCARYTLGRGRVLYKKGSKNPTKKPFLHHEGGFW